MKGVRLKKEKRELNRLQCGVNYDGHKGNEVLYGQLVVKEKVKGRVGFS